MMADSIRRGYYGDPLFELELRISSIAVTVGNFLILGYPAKSRKIAVSIDSSVGKYSKIYGQLAERISEIPECPTGHIQRFILQAISKEAYAGSLSQDLNPIIASLETIQASGQEEDFNQFAVSQACDYGDHKHVLHLLESFQQFKQASADLDRELDQRRVRVPVAY